MHTSGTLGRHDEAETLTREATKLQEVGPGSENGLGLSLEYLLEELLFAEQIGGTTWAHLRQSKPREAMQFAEESPETEHDFRIRSRNFIVQCEAAGEAEKVESRHAKEVVAMRNPADEWDYLHLADEAEELIRKAMNLAEATFGPEDAATIQCREALMRRRESREMKEQAQLGQSREGNDVKADKAPSLSAYKERPSAVQASAEPRQVVEVSTHDEAS